MDESVPGMKIKYSLICIKSWQMVAHGLNLTRSLCLQVTPFVKSSLSHPVLSRAELEVVPPYLCFVNHIAILAVTFY